MLIRPQQALPLARNNSKLLIFNNSSKIINVEASLSDLYQEKEDNPHFFFLSHIFSRTSYVTCCRRSKLTFLHRVKERKTPSLSAQASFAPFSLKVAWSGKSLILPVADKQTGLTVGISLWRRGAEGGGGGGGVMTGVSSRDGLRWSTSRPVNTPHDTPLSSSIRPAQTPVTRPRLVSGQVNKSVSPNLGGSGPTLV